MVEERQLTAVLVELAATLATDFPITGVLDRLVTCITDVVPVTSAGLTMIDSSGRPRYIAASDDGARRYEKLQSSLAEGPCLRAFTTGDAVSVPDLATDTQFPTFAPAAFAAGLAAVFAFPLRHRNTRFGALDLYVDTPGQLDERSMQAARTLADVAGAYVLNDRARNDVRQLRDKAMRDELTGLPNHRLLEARLQHASERASRSGAGASVLFIDLDRFKQVNDTYGHDTGDHLLRAVADRLRAVLRPGDTLARIYGDEFVLLCEELEPGTPTDLVVRRLRAAFEAPFAVDGVELALGASIGIAYAGPAEALSRRHVALADQDMYAEKRRKSFLAPDTTT